MSLKSIFQEKLHQNNIKKYEMALQEEEKKYASAYQTKLKQEETDLFQRELQKVPEKINTKGDFTVVPFVCVNSGFDIAQISTDYVLFVRPDGYLSSSAYDRIRNAFQQNTDANIVYAYEDEILLEAGEQGLDKIDAGKWETQLSARKNPWIKPIWSPDTLLSFFCFGNMMAVRTKALSTINSLTSDNYRKNIYDMALKLTFGTDKTVAWDMRKTAVLVEQVLYHRIVETSENMTETKKAIDSFSYNEPNEFIFGYEEEYADIKKNAYEALGYKAKVRLDNYGLYQVHPVSDGRKVSILIPSKDHPEVLERCVKSIRNLTTYEDYEIIVVDNGSNEEHKFAYEALAKQFEFTYYYAPMNFNFSVMCNKAAELATGAYYLFLNDDMEILQEDWLELLTGTALLAHVGAVGAKLFYPESTLIQHAGITNLTEGPVHKLQGEEDKNSYYFGMNRMNRDMIGVTAACLMVTKEKFLEIDGFYEGLAVAYNDVDFNYKLLDKGYYNVLLNDVILYHHESLSRGNDMVDDSKLQRLKKENYTLYERNPEYYGKDPFYGSWMTGVSNDYEICYPFENRNLESVTGLKKSKELPGKNGINETLIISVDHAEKDRLIMADGTQNYLIDLHAHVRGLDSADYEYQMYLRSGENVYEVPCIRRYREDVVKNLYNELHVELSGFVAKIPVGMLAKGEYELWMKAAALTSRQVLWNKAKSILVVEE